MSSPAEDLLRELAVSAISLAGKAAFAALSSDGIDDEEERELLAQAAETAARLDAKRRLEGG